MPPNRRAAVSTIPEDRAGWPPGRAGRGPNAWSRLVSSASCSGPFDQRTWSPGSDVTSSVSSSTCRSRRADTPSPAPGQEIGDPDSRSRCTVGRRADAEILVHDLQRRLGKLPSIAALLRCRVRQRVEPLLDAAQGRLELLGAILGLGTALVDVERRQHDEREQLEELGLPVLERRVAELGQEVADLGRLAVPALLVGEHLPLGDALGEPRHQEQDHQDEAEPELAPDAPLLRGARRRCCARSSHRGRPGSRS